LQVVEENNKLLTEYKEKYERAEENLRKLEEKKQDNVKKTAAPNPTAPNPTAGHFPTTKSAVSIEGVGESSDLFEERRITKAFGKYGSASNLNYVSKQPTSPPPGLQSPPPNQRVTNRISDDQLPDWKKRQLEQEQAQAERVEQEHLRKLEVLKSISHSELVEIDNEAKEVSKTSIAYPDVIHPKDDIEMESQELLRLERILNRHSNKKNS